MMMRNLENGTIITTSDDIRVDEQGEEDGVVDGMVAEDVKDSDDKTLNLGKGDVSAVESTDNEPQWDPIFNRLSPIRKRIVVAIVSYCGLIAPFASSAFLPSIPQISQDLHASPELINYTISIFLVSIGIAPLGWAAWGQLYGRRSIYLVSLPLAILGSLGVALCTDITSLIITRIIQGIGSSSVLSIGAGTIGDIHVPTERGRAMGLYYGGILVGPAFAPVIAGLMTSQHNGWRHVQWLICGVTTLGFLLVLFGLPETAHWKVRKADEKVQPSEKEGKKKWWELDLETSDGRTGLVWINPLRPLRLLSYPHILLMSLNSSLVLFGSYCLLVPLTFTIGPRYNITSPALLGLFFLSAGIGNVIGSRIAGIQSDWVVKYWIKRRNGVFKPEDRLWATLIGGALVYPGGLLTYGFVVENGAGGIPTCVFLLVVCGIGLMLVLTASNTYCVDVTQKNSAEVIAANNCLRYIFSAAASAGILPLVKAIGVGPANAIAAGLGWLGCLCVCIVIRWGDILCKRAGTEISGQIGHHKSTSSVTLGGEIGQARINEEKKEQK